MAWDKILFHYFAGRNLDVSAPFVEETLQFPLKGDGNPVENQLTIDGWVYFWILNSILLIFISLSKTLLGFYLTCTYEKMFLLLTYSVPFVLLPYCILGCRTPYCDGSSFEHICLSVTVFLTCQSHFKIYMLTFQHQSQVLTGLVFFLFTSR